MTNREFLSAVANSNVADDIKTYALEAVEKLDARNAKRSSKPSKTAIENEPVKAQILEFITNSGGTCIASVIGEAIGITTNKASSLCGQLVEAGKLAVTDVKVPKQGKRKGYSIPTEE